VTTDGTDNPGRRAYEDYWARQMADPEFRCTYEEEAAKQEVWLQLGEARRFGAISLASTERLAPPFSPSGENGG
jgi:hypothetical protein